jgi:hypothetical protein
LRVQSTGNQTADLRSAFAVALAEPSEPAEESGPVWSAIATEGEHFARSGGRMVPLTEADIDDMVRNHRDVVMAEGWFPHGPPIGYNHASQRGALSADDTRAAGFIVDLRKGRDPKTGKATLEGLNDWNGEGRDRIRNREFQAFSIEFLPAGKAHSKVTGEPIKGAVLFGGTLTNHPFVPGLPAIAASEDGTAPAPSKERKSMNTLTTHLGLAEDAAEASILAEVRKRDERITALSEQVATLTDEKATTAKALDDALSQRDALQAEKDQRAEADKAVLLGEFVAQGRIANTDEAKSDAWAVVQTLGEEKARALYPKNGEFRTEARGHDGGRGGEAGDKSPEEKFAQTLAEAKAAGKSDEEAYYIARDTHVAALAGRYAKEN